MVSTSIIYILYLASTIHNIHILYGCVEVFEMYCTPSSGVLLLIVCA